MADGTYQLTIADHTATLTLTNGRSRNPLGLDLMLALTAELEGIAGRDDVHAVVIDAEGPAFSAGHNLKEMRDRELGYQTAVFDACTQLMLGVHAIPQPVVACIDGIATAAGCQLVAACDLAVASDHSTFATPGVKIGLFCSTPMVPLSRAIGRKRAMQMLLTGEPIDASTALDWGLINMVVPSPELPAAVDELVASITRYSPHVIGIGKAAFYEQIDRTEPAAYDLTKEVMSSNAVDPAAREGIGAFLDKRDPEWPH